MMLKHGFPRAAKLRITMHYIIHIVASVFSACPVTRLNLWNTGRGNFKMREARILPVNQCATKLPLTREISLETRWMMIAIGYDCSKRRVDE